MAFRLWWGLLLALACRVRDEPPLIFNRAPVEPPAEPNKTKYWKSSCEEKKSRPFCVHRWTSLNTGFLYCACCPEPIPLDVCKLRF